MAKKILLVDDDEFILTVYKRQLEMSETSTAVEANAAEALEATQKAKYDLILLDILLPDIGEFDVLKQIEEDGINKNTPVVLLANLGQDSVIKEGFALGAKKLFA